MTAAKPGQRQPAPLAAFMLGCLMAGILLGPHQQLRSGELGSGAQVLPAAYLPPAQWHMAGTEQAMEHGTTMFGPSCCRCSSDGSAG